MNCLNEEFPDNSILSHHKQCNNQLSVLKRNKGETIAIPHMLYPILFRELIMVSAVCLYKSAIIHFVMKIFFDIMP